jgi:hypothetical protein
VHHPHATSHQVAMSGVNPAIFEEDGTLNFHEVKEDVYYREHFKRFCKQEYSIENVLFWYVLFYCNNNTIREQCREYKATDAFNRRQKATDIYTMFLTPDSELEVNVTQSLTKKLERVLFKKEFVDNNKAFVERFNTKRRTFFHEPTSFYKQEPDTVLRNTPPSPSVLSPMDVETNSALLDVEVIIPPTPPPPKELVTSFYEEDDQLPVNLYEFLELEIEIVLQDTFSRFVLSEMYKSMIEEVKEAIAYIPPNTQQQALWGSVAELIHVTKNLNTNLHGSIKNIRLDTAGLASNSMVSGYVFPISPTTKFRPYERVITPRTEPTTPRTEPTTPPSTPTAFAIEKPNDYITVRLIVQEGPIRAMVFSGLEPPPQVTKPEIPSVDVVDMVVNHVSAVEMVQSIVNELVDNIQDTPTTIDVPVTEKPVELDELTVMVDNPTCGETSPVQEVVDMDVVTQATESIQELVEVAPTEVDHVPQETQPVLVAPTEQPADITVSAASHEVADAKVETHDNVEEVSEQTTTVPTVDQVEEQQQVTTVEAPAQPVEEQPIKEQPVTTNVEPVVAEPTTTPRPTVESDTKPISEPDQSSITPAKEPTPVDNEPITEKPIEPPTIEHSDLTNEQVFMVRSASLKESFKKHISVKDLLKKYDQMSKQDIVSPPVSPKPKPSPRSNEPDSTAVVANDDKTARRKSFNIEVVKINLEDIVRQSGAQTSRPKKIGNSIAERMKAFEAQPAEHVFVKKPTTGRSMFSLKKDQK